VLSGEALYFTRQHYREIVSEGEENNMLSTYHLILEIKKSQQTSKIGRRLYCQTSPFVQQTVNRRHIFLYSLILSFNVYSLGPEFQAIELQ
jgi:hypothetical protein